jgi:hypothetical protein
MRHEEDKIAGMNTTCIVKTYTEGFDPIYQGTVAIHFNLNQ